MSVINDRFEFLKRKGWKYEAGCLLLKKGEIELECTENIEISNSGSDDNCLVVTVNKEGDNLKKLVGLLRSNLAGFEYLRWKTENDIEKLTQPYGYHNYCDDDSTLRIYHPQYKYELFGRRSNTRFLHNYNEVFVYSASFLAVTSMHGYVETNSGDNDYKYITWKEGKPYFILYSDYGKKIVKSVKIAAELSGISEDYLFEQIKDTDFEITNHAISEAYSDRTNLSSCMSNFGNEMQDFYSNIEEFEGLAILSKEDTKGKRNIRARALIFNIDDKIIIDRVYPSDCNHNDYKKLLCDIKKEFKGKTIIHRDTDGLDLPENLDNMKITWKGSSTPQFIPYLDTFRSMRVSKEDKLIFKCTRGSLMCEGTEGGFIVEDDDENEVCKYDFQHDSLESFIDRVRHDRFEGGNTQTEAVDDVRIDMTCGGGYDIAPLSTAMYDEDDCYYNEALGQYVNDEVYSFLSTFNID